MDKHLDADLAFSRCNDVREDTIKSPSWGRVLVITGPGRASPAGEWAPINRDDDPIVTNTVFPGIPAGGTWKIPYGVNFLMEYERNDPLHKWVIEYF